MALTRVAAVTGANKGIGFAIVRNLALAYPTSALSSNGTSPLLIYLTARDPARGEQAVKDIRSDPQLAAAKALRQHGGLTDVQYAPLDVADEESRRAFVEFMKREHPEGLDVLVNNAGVALDGGFDADIVHRTLQINYHGTLALTLALLPHIRSSTISNTHTGRIVTLSSMIGKLNKYPPSITSAFRRATSPSQITKLMQDFEDAVKRGTYKAEGWPGSAYAVSKCGIAGATMVLGKEKNETGAEGQGEEEGEGEGKEEGQGGKSKKVLINVCCPGYVRTDMTKERGRKTPDQGAKTPVKLALGDIGSASGEFWEHEDVTQW